MEKITKFVVIVLGGLLNAVALNLFLIPANVYASGFTGVAQLISSLLDLFHIPVSTGVLLFLLNIPVIYLGWKKVGKSFTIYSSLSVMFTTLFLGIVPVQSVSEDIILNAVFGGVIAAVGIGYTLKYGASTGGMDIIALYLSRLKDQPLGRYFFILNAVIIVAAGMIFGWEKALYTLVALYVTTRVIDVIHTRYAKLTVMIITKKGEAMQKAIHQRLVRGITKIPAKGAYKNEDKEVLLIVITKYELYTLEHLIKDIDPHAFTNIMHTESIFGFFRQD